MDLTNNIFMAFSIIFWIPIYIILLILTLRFSSTISLYFDSKIRNIKVKKSQYNDIYELHREIDVKYSPAVLSYLIDNKLEPKKDITATILNLYARKIVNIEKKYGKYCIVKGRNIEEQLGEDEKYIYENCVNTNKHEGFNINEWYLHVKKEYEKYDFEDKGLKKKIEIIRYLAILVVQIISIVLTNITVPFSEILYGVNAIKMVTLLGVYFFVCYIIFSILYSIYLNVIEERSYLKENGEKEILKWFKFKKFIENYTLIEDRTIEETQIYERYIPYAMALNINKEYHESVEIFSKKGLDEITRFLHF